MTDPGKQVERLREAQRTRVARAHDEVVALIEELQAADSADVVWGPGFEPAFYLDRARKALATADRHLRRAADPRAGEPADAIPRKRGRKLLRSRLREVEGEGNG